MAHGKAKFCSLAANNLLVQKEVGMNDIRYDIQTEGLQKEAGGASWFMQIK